MAISSCRALTPLCLQALLQLVPQRNSRALARPLQVGLGKSCQLVPLTWLWLQGPPLMLLGKSRRLGDKRLPLIQPRRSTWLDPRPTEGVSVMLVGSLMEMTLWTFLPRWILRWPCDRTSFPLLARRRMCAIALCFPIYMEKAGSFSAIMRATRSTRITRHLPIAIGLRITSKRYVSFFASSWEWGRPQLLDFASEPWELRDLLLVGL